MKTRAVALRQAGTPWEITGGRIRLTGLIYRKYAPDEINDGYAGLKNGKNVRGVVIHQH